MTSKEKLISLVSALEVIGETSIKKDVVKQYKEDILKDLFILDLIKPLIEIIENTKYTSDPRYYIKLRQDVFITDETKKIIKEWLNNE